MHNLLLALICLFGTVELTRAEAAVFIPVPPVPGATSTAATGINDNNIIVGYYFGQPYAHGFFGTVDGNYTVFDAGDGSFSTTPLGIDNAGDITGWAGLGICATSAFERSPNGTITYVRKHQTQLIGEATGLNKKRQFVGFYCESGAVKGFFGKDGKYKAPLTVEGDPFWTLPTGINSAGTVVGFYDTVGFVLQGNQTTVVSYPGAASTQLIGVNDRGIASGSWSDSTQSHAFLFDISANKFTSIEPPHAQSSQAGGINSEGLVAVNSNIGSFIYCPKAKRKCPGSSLATK